MSQPPPAANVIENCDDPFDASGEDGPSNFEELARNEALSAIALHDQGLYQQAYSHAGMAVEMALKCRIMRVFRYNCWPTRRSKPELHTHNLSNLLALCGLEDHINQAVMDDPQPAYAMGWLLIHDWRIDMRYESPHAFPKARSLDAIEALTTLGLIDWLLK